MRSRHGRWRPALPLVICSALALAACASSAASGPPSAVTDTSAPTAVEPTIATVPLSTVPATTVPPTTVPATTAPPTTVPPSTTESATGRVTMAFTGDVLAHRVINRAALQPDGSYDYTSMLANIAPLVSTADIAVCHLEAPIAPPDQEVMVEPQRISSAASITNALAFAGFDRCSTASNHSVDRGAAGVDATVAAFEAAGMGQSGVARTEAERDMIRKVIADVESPLPIHKGGDRADVGESSEVEGQLVVRRELHVLDLCGQEAHDRREALDVAHGELDAEPTWPSAATIA